MENILYGFVGLANNLNVFTANFDSSSKSGECYYVTLYDELSLLRQSQNSDEMLVVTIIDGNSKQIEIKKNKLMKLRAGRMECYFQNLLLNNNHETYY